MKRFILPALVLAFSTSAFASRPHRMECVNAMVLGFTAGEEVGAMSVEVRTQRGTPTASAGMLELLDGANVAISSVEVEIIADGERESTTGQMTAWMPIASVPADMKDALEDMVLVDFSTVNARSPEGVPSVATEARFIVTADGEIIMEQKTARGKIFSELPFGFVCQQGIQRQVQRLIRLSAEME